MKKPLLSVVLYICLACSAEQPTIALNWYARIGHAPGCGPDNVALLAGKDTLLCPLEEAIFNGDSLVARSEGKCYFIDLQNISAYKNATDCVPIDCATFEEFITVQADGWPHSFQEKEVIEL